LLKTPQGIYSVGADTNDVEVVISQGLIVKYT